MASILPDVMDRLIALMKGGVSGLDRPIPASRFEHADWEVDTLLSRAVSAPYPYNVDDIGEFQPADVPSTLSGDQVWHGCQWLIRVAYAASPHNQQERLKTIQRDRYQIRRALSYPLNWLTVGGLGRVLIEEGTIDTAEIPGGEFDDVEILHVLEIPVELTYREDHS